MTNSPDERGLELRELFFETAQELLQALNEEALKLEKNTGDEEIVRSIRRTVHTLKGDSAACGLRELSELAHQFEDALSLESAASHAAVAEIAFAAADIFAEMIVAYRKNSRLPATKNLSKKIQELMAPPKAAKARGTKKAAAKATRGKTASKVATSKATSKSVSLWTEYETLAMSKAQAAGQDVLHVVAKFDPHCAMPIAGRQLVHNAIGTMGPVIAIRPDAKSPAATKSIEFVIATMQTAEQIAAKCKIPTIVEEVSVELLLAGKAGAQTSPLDPVAAATADPEREAEAHASEAPAISAPTSGPVNVTQENVLRVEAGRIDNVLNLVGELIIGKSMLSRTVAEFDRRFQRDPLAAKFADALGFQTRVLDTLQKSVMKIRMVPVEQLFRRFPRIVRDIAKLRGKDVALSVSGESTGLDKSILEPLAEPITHLIRNCVDHGIEPPEERIAAGKPARGTIRLSARHEGNHVVIEVGDDGRGIVRERIVERAIELGYVTPEEARQLTDMEALSLIFIQGFTMLREVTQISGRGVGMDVVKTGLAKLKGTVSVLTTVGKGTTFLLQLPLTLASIKALLAEVGGHLYAIPVASVVEITRVTESEIHEVDGHEVFQLRNQVLKLVRLDRLNSGAPARASRRLFVIVIALGDRRYGLGVDNLRGEEELVIKALDSRLTQTDFVNGASILGDGTVVMILNLPTVVSRLSRAVMAEVLA